MSKCLSEQKSLFFSLIPLPFKSQNLFLTFLDKTTVPYNQILKLSERRNMSKQKTKEELLQHKNTALAKLDHFIHNLIETEDPKIFGKADKLSYWIEDWITFLDFEKEFSPLSLRRYNRGEIIKVHLGFNIGSEEGGLHYAVILDKNNPKSSPVVTIVPLTSVKPQTDITNLKSGSVFLGNELFTNLNTKISSTQKHLTEELHLLQKLTNNLGSLNHSERFSLSSRIEKASLELKLLNRMHLEVLKMKKGSIALVNQITTISKIRIYDPKTNYDILSNIKLSNKNLDLIDAEIIRKYTNN